jgi:hypothetical protein
VPTIPEQVGDITVHWLNEVLGDAGDRPVGEIVGFDAEPLGHGIGILGQLARLHLVYADGATGPHTLIAKCQSPAPENQALSRTMGFYLREVSFYREVADRVPIRVPHAYHAECGPDGLPFVLLLEEIEGAHCPDQIAGISPWEAEHILDVAARLHAAFWDTDELRAMTWLPPMNNPLYHAGQQLAEARWPGFVERFGERFGPDTMAWLDRACRSYSKMLDHVAAMDHLTFTHTDCRAENYLFGGSAGNDVVTMIDFQLSTRHFGPWDVANLLAGSMTPEVRRSCEAELVERYHRRLVELGVDGYTLDRCWLDYRLSLLQASVAQVIVSDLQGGNERGDELLEHLFVRPIIAAADHGVGELIDRFA